MVLEYLKLFISWPFVVLVLGLYFLIAFKKSLSDFFQRITSGEAYGVKIEAASPSEQKKDIKEAPKFKTELEIEQYVKNNPTQVIKEYQQVLNGYWFERAYNIIYGSQILLVEHLTSKGEIGDKYINLISFYNEFLKQSKLSSTQMPDYLNFLFEMRFIEYKGKENDITVVITPLGTNFLSYIKTQYPSSYKIKAF